MRRGTIVSNTCVRGQTVEDGELLGGGGGTGEAEMCQCYGKREWFQGGGHERRRSSGTGKGPSTNQIVR